MKKLLREGWYLRRDRLVDRNKESESKTRRTGDRTGMNDVDDDSAHTESSTRV